jgi:copper chaperone
VYNQKVEIMETSIVIQNLKCGGCANTITTKLEELNGVKAVVVNIEESSVKFHHTNETTVEMVKEKLKSLGYPEENEVNSLGNKAKSYVSCMIGKINS